MQRSKSNSLHSEALHHLVGGVNSPVRAFKSVHGNPIYFDKASGAIVTDVDGNEYIDLSLSNGMISFGHAYEFNEGLKSSNSRLSYKNHGFADKISTLLKADRYSKKILFKYKKSNRIKQNL